MSNSNFYIGYTDDINRRYEEHQKGKVKTTSKYLPVGLIFYEAYINKKDAQRREKYFKTSKGRASLRMMLSETLKDLPQTT